MLSFFALGLALPVAYAADDDLAVGGGGSPPCRKWYFRDFDGDTYGTFKVRTQACRRPPGFSARSGDCKESDPAIHPGASEVWYDGVDQNCDRASDFDADGDGYDSAAEAGGYDCDDADASLVPGTSVGLCATDFELQDSTGAWDTLWNYYGDVVLVDISAGWCGTCQSRASQLETLYNDYSSSGLSVLTVLYEDASYQPADVSFAATWASTFGLTHPVLADPDFEAYGLYFQAGQPSYAIIDREGTIRFLDSGVSVSTLESEIAGLL